VLRIAHDQTLAAATRVVHMRAYRDREPRAPMEAQEVVRLLDLLEAARATVWLDGGWGVDALLGGQTREHDDLDLVAPLAEVPRLTEALVSAGYEHVAGGSPKSFVLVDPDGRQVDVHPVVFDQARGGGVYQMDDGREWVYPAAGFEGRGEVAGRRVRCLSPEVQVLVHNGYELTDKDYLELYLLHERFGVFLPEQYAPRALEVGGRFRA
jgi:lincosamide nucleotidyltransferase A/C/D/E